MFFRTKRIKNSSVLQLVESYRDNIGKVKQKIVVSLGKLHVPNRERKEIAKAVEDRLSGQESLFPLRASVAKWTDIIIKKIEETKLTVSRHPVDNISSKEEIADGVLVDRIEHENETILGSVLVLKKAWDDLGIGDYLKENEFTESQINASMASVFNRLIAPESEHCLPLWCSTVSLDEILNDRLSASGDDRFYRVSDALLKVREGLEKHLRRREKSLFNLDDSIILYDLTNSYFEGECERNPKAKRGKSKEKRDDCPLLSLGLVVDKAGFVLGHEVFEGNRNDSKTLLNMVRILSKYRQKQSKSLVVIDGGIATEKNLKCLKENDYEYVVAGKRQSRADFYEDFCDHDSFSLVPNREDNNPVFVKRTVKNEELIILCRSEERKLKEDAILSKIEEKFLAELNLLSERLKSPKTKFKHIEAIQRSIGRLQQKYTRAAKHYSVTYKDGCLNWSRLSSYDKAASLHGTYILRSSMLDLKDDEVWKIYINLTKVEEAFRHLKGELGLRPFRHHKEARCEAHTWITILAYHLQRWIEYSLEMADCPSSWRNIKILLQTHCYSTLTIPSRDGLIRRMRKAGKPDEKQRSIYQKLNVEYRNLPVIKFEKLKKM